MNKINIIKRIVSIVIFIITIAILGHTIQTVLKPENSIHYGMLTGFENEEEDSIDVLFLGASNTFHSINPLVLYENTGITGYVLSSGSQSLNITETYLKEALRTQSPKVVCLEVVSSRYDLNDEIYEQRWRWGYTYFPSGLNMYKSVYSYLKQVDSEFLSYIFPTLRYKDRWQELTESDFEIKTRDQYYKGFFSSETMREVTYPESYWEKTNWSMPESSLKSLNNIKQICDENNIELVLFKSPTTTLWKQEFSDAIQTFADENNIVFIDYNTRLEELGISIYTDFHDAGHLNKYGAEKLTKHMGVFLQKNYSLKDHRSDAENSWDVSIQERARREADFSGQDLDAYLDQINHDNYTVVCMINGGVDTSIYETLNRKFPLVSNAFVYENGENIFVNTTTEAFSWHLEFDEKDIALKYVPPVLDEMGSIITPVEYGLYINGDNYILVNRGINFVIIDNELQEIISIVAFDADNGYAVVRAK